jgi:ferric-dicitrate binding protein FerR (iron transport regulator)
MMTDAPPGYRPGVCNIGPSERRRRYRYAGVSGVVAVACAAAVLAWSVPNVLLIGLFVPLSLGTEFLLQAQRSFCAVLGFRGRFDLDGGTDGSMVPDGGAGHVTDPAARRADRRHAARLTVLGVLGGATGTALVYGAVALLG